jgi:hypothetical protein
VTQHSRALDPEKLRVPEGHFLRKAPTIWFAASAVGIVACAVLAMMSDEPRQFYFSWLVAFMYFLSIALGGLFFVLIQHAARAGWSVTVRRIAENAMGTLPVFALLFVPILVGMHHLFEWTHVEHVRHDTILQAKEPFLNVPFFVGRAAMYFAVWALLAWWFRKTSLTQDESGDSELTRVMQRRAGPSLYAFAFTATFAAFDWLMSLQPHWYSTIFGGYFFAGSVVAIHALLIIVVNNLQASGLLGRAVTGEHLHDLGKMLFAFVVFWAYMAFSQFMLIWYANIPEETTFFHARSEGSWLTVSKILLFGHFLMPFFFLLPRTVKRMRPLLYAGAVYLLVLHFVDVYWLAMPILHPEGVHLSLMDLAAFLAIGGAFIGLFLRNVTRAALVPLHDPRMPEALAHEVF